MSPVNYARSSKYSTTSIGVYGDFYTRRVDKRRVVRRILILETLFLLFEWFYKQNCPNLQKKKLYAFHLGPVIMNICQTWSTTQGDDKKYSPAKKKI